MSVPPNTRRRIAPGATMVLSVLGALALLVTFVVQVAAAESPRDTGAVPAHAMRHIEQFFESPAASAGAGDLRPETVEVLERTDEDIVAVAFLTTADELGIGIFPESGGAMGVTNPGRQSSWVSMRIPGADSTRKYALSVRRLPTGYDHTFTAK